MDWIWIGFGFNISELNGYGLDLELELSPSGTSAHMYWPVDFLTKTNLYFIIYNIFIYLYTLHYIRELA